MTETNQNGLNQEEPAESQWDDSTSFAVQRDRLPDGRSFAAEMWGEAGYTFLTYRFPIQGLEHLSKLQIVEYLLAQGIQIDLQQFPAENMQLLANFTNHDLVDLTITIGEGDE